MLLTLKGQPGSGDAFRFHGRGGRGMNELSPKESVYTEGELDESATCKEYLQVQNEGTGLNL